MIGQFRIYNKIKLKSLENRQKYDIQINVCFTSFINLLNFGKSDYKTRLNNELQIKLNAAGLYRNVVKGKFLQIYWELEYLGSMTEGV